MFSGALTALATPMKGDGELDLERLRELVERQITAGINGLVPCGTTGEAATLSLEERHEVIKTVVVQAAGRVPVIAGAGANDTAVAMANGRMAAEAGADALLHVTPYYNKPSQRALLAHFGRLAHDASLPVVLYNVPGRTSCDMLADTVIQAAGIPGVVGVKEATADLRRASDILAGVPREFAVLSGDDFTCMPMTLLGGAGVISVVSNVLPGETAGMIRAAREGRLEEARRLHYMMLPLMGMLFMESNPVPAKACLALMGLSDNALRLPLLPLEGEGMERLQAELVRLGVLP